jgi:hypothetical protein
MPAISVMRGIVMTHHLLSGRTQCASVQSPNGSASKMFFVDDRPPSSWVLV